MAFLAAVLALVVIVLFVLVATCAHLLARLMRLEAAERVRAASADGGGTVALRLHAPLPTSIAAQLELGDVTRSVSLHVVSAGCATCRSVIDTLCSVRTNGVDRRIVVGHEADRALLPGACAVPIVVSREMVHTAVMTGLSLPVVVRVERGEIVAIEPGSAVDA
jgi:hypothetical protein